jgi:hypothetical protein
MSAIFRDQTMWFVNHDKKLCQRIDKEGMAELSSQLEAAMKEFEKIPPEQRAMMEKMMKGKMPGMEEPPEHRVEKGGVEQVGECECTVHALYSDENKVSEVCVADESVGADIAEAMGAFRAMSRFTEDLQRFVQRSPFVSMVESPYSRIDEVGGFPVRVRMFDGEGKVVQKSTLKSITRQDIGEAVLAIPKGYKVKDLSDQIKKGR